VLKEVLKGLKVRQGRKVLKVVLAHKEEFKVTQGHKVLKEL
jgi:hypothetical protein